MASRAFPTWAAGLGLWALCLLWAGPSWAQEPAVTPGVAFGQGPPATSDPMLRGSTEEREALAAYESGRPIAARELAEKILEKDPDSFLAHWVMAQIFHSREGRHPRARYLFSQMKRRLVSVYGARPTDEAAQWWHRRILEAEVSLLGEMDRVEEQIAMLDEHDALYRPRLSYRRIWPLMKMRRYDEAEALAKALIRTNDLGDRLSGYNGLMAIEDERRNLYESYRWGQEGIEVMGGRSCILFHNSAQAALSLLRFDEAETHARKAIRAEFEDCPSSSYYHLVTIYLAQGAFDKAISAYKQLRKSRIEPRYRPLFEREHKGRLLEILLALGKSEEAREAAKLIYERPDRPGMTSSSLDTIRFYTGSQYWLALEQVRLLTLERASMRPFFKSLALRLEAREIALTQWQVARTMLTLAPKQQILRSATRPYMGLVPSWNVGNLIEILGLGVMQAAYNEASEIEIEVLGDGGRGYFAALEAEIRLRGGQAKAALEGATRALELLQAQQTMMRRRTQAVALAAHVALGQGHGGDAQRLWREILSEQPILVRLFNLKIPMHLTHDGQPDSVALAEWLGRSSRFSREGEAAPFILNVESRGSESRICLSSRDGFRIDCVPFDREEARDSSDWVAEAADHFHEALFVPKIGLTSLDINSLDGSPIRARADEALEGLIRRRNDAGENR